MSDHHQHGALIARPPKREAARHASGKQEESCGACVHGAAPFSGHSTMFGRFLTRLFAEKRDESRPAQ